MVLSHSSDPKFFPQLHRTLTVPQTSLHSLSRSLAYCAKAVQLAQGRLLGGSAIGTGVHSMCS